MTDDQREPVAPEGEQQPEVEEVALQPSRDPAPSPEAAAPDAQPPPADAEEGAEEGAAEGAEEGAAEASTEEAGSEQGDGADGSQVDESQVDEPQADELTVTKLKLEETTLDLQRVQAEFLNYKRRVERDRERLREDATYAALTPIIDVLDAIDRAREHEPLEGGFKAVAEQLERTVAGVGLVKFGEPGDAFDPTVHDALSHVGTSADVEVTTCQLIAKSGYKIGDRVVRAAQVLVVDPE